MVQQLETIVKINLEAIVITHKAEETVQVKAHKDQATHQVIILTEAVGAICLAVAEEHTAEVAVEEEHLVEEEDKNFKFN